MHKSCNELWKESLSETTYVVHMPPYHQFLSNAKNFNLALKTDLIFTKSTHVVLKNGVKKNLPWMTGPIPGSTGGTFSYQSHPIFAWWQLFGPIIGQPRFCHPQRTQAQSLGLLVGVGRPSQSPEGHWVPRVVEGAAPWPLGPTPRSCLQQWTTHPRHLCSEDARVQQEGEPVKIFELGQLRSTGWGSMAPAAFSTSPRSSRSFGSFKVSVIKS